MTATSDIKEFITKGGVHVRRTTEPEIYEGARMLLVDALVLDVLGLGEVMKVNRERDAVRIHADHPFFSHFRAEKMVAA